jgi:hypothetical protein
VRLVDERSRSTAATAEMDLLERLDYDGVMRELVARFRPELYGASQ